MTKIYEPCRRCKEYDGIFRSLYDGCFDSNSVSLLFLRDQTNRFIAYVFEIGEQTRTACLEYCQSSGCENLSIYDISVLKKLVALLNKVSTS